MCVDTCFLAVVLIGFHEIREQFVNITNTHEQQAGGRRCERATCTTGANVRQCSRRVHCSRLHERTANNERVLAKMFVPAPIREQTNKKTRVRSCSFVGRLFVFANSRHWFSLILLEGCGWRPAVSDMLWDVYARTHTPSPHAKVRASAPRVCHMYQLTVENGGMSRLIQCIGAQIRVGLGVEVRNGRSFVAQTRLDAKLIKINISVSFARQLCCARVTSFSRRLVTD